MTRLRLILVSFLALTALLVGPLPAPTARAEGELIPSDIVHVDHERLAALPIDAGSAPVIAEDQLTAFASNDVGAMRHFLSLDDALGLWYFKTFILRSIGDNVEVWVATDMQFPLGDCRGPVEVTQEQIDYLQREFDDKIYPTDTGYFGPPETRNGTEALLPEEYRLPPDYYAGSSREILLIDNIRDPNYYDLAQYPTRIGGYFVPGFALVFDRNIITIDSFDFAHRLGPNPPDEPTNNPCTDRPARPYQFEATIAHEYQHLIHEDYDPDELNWVNEGMSDFAEYLNGYTTLSLLEGEVGANGHIQAFLGWNRQFVVRGGRPVRVITAGAENSLPVWGDQGEAEILSDYGHAFAFMLYANEKLGGARFMRAWQNSPVQGIAGFQVTLAAFGLETNFARVYHDFAVAMLVDRLLDDGFTAPVETARYQVHTLRAQINVDTAHAYDGPGAPPWGSDYVRIGSPAGLSALAFDGADNIVRRSPWTTRSSGPAGWQGGAVIWSGHRNNGDVLLVRRLTLGEGPQILSFDTYFDIEECYDYGFVQVSTDGGRTYRSLGNADTRDCRDEEYQDPRVTANLPGFTGQTPGWVRTTFDLSAYAGQTIVLAFRYITDPAAGGNDDSPANDGWWIDNVTLNDTVLSDGSLTDWGDVTGVRPIPTAFTVQIVGVGERRFTVVQLPVGGEGRQGSLDAAQLAELATYDYLVAVVTFDAPTDPLRIAPVPDYAPYALTVTRGGETTTLPGGGR